MRSTFARLAPALLVLMLLAAATTHLRAGGRAATPAMPVPPPCDNVVESQTSGTTVQPIAVGTGVIQPLGEISNLSQSGLIVYGNGYTYDASRLSIRSWDPLALAPDPSTVALRSVTFVVSTYSYYPAQMSWAPPVVLRTLSNVAEP